MKKVQNCPVCFDPLVTKELTPCMDCGGSDFELDHYKTHTYKEWEVIFGSKLILCDFCDVDFGSYQPAFFGFKNGQRMEFDHFNIVRDIQYKNLRKGLYCNSCKMTKNFLDFVVLCREKNAENLNAKNR